jgi:hypothetical protein
MEDIVWVAKKFGNGDCGGWCVGFGVCGWVGGDGCGGSWGTDMWWHLNSSAHHGVPQGSS